MDLQTVLPPGINEEDVAAFMFPYFEPDEAGRIVHTYRLPRRVFVSMRLAGRNVIEGNADPESQWFDGAQLRDRPESTVTLDGLTLRNISTPAFVYVDGERHVCNDAEVELEFKYPGRVKVSVDCFPEKLVSFEIENPS